MLYKIAKFILKPIFNTLYVVKVQGLEKLPKGNGYIVCGNHIKAVDPILIGINLPDKINFMTKFSIFLGKPWWTLTKLLQ